MDFDSSMFVTALKAIYGRRGASEFDLECQRKLARDNEAPPCYDASLSYCPRTAKLGFVNSFQQVRNLVGTSITMGLQTTRPAIEHGVVPSISSIKDLRRVTVRQIAEKVNYIHIDSVMFVTVAHAPFRQIATNVLVQDGTGDCIMLALYNYVTTGEDPADVFCVGMRLALLAPYMKNAQDDRTKTLMLRCDNPQCVVVYDDGDSWMADQQNGGEGDLSRRLGGGEGERERDTPSVLETPSVLRKKGNKDFKRGDLRGAERWYTRALRSIDTQRKTNMENFVDTENQEAHITSEHQHV
eukprot:Selendium_serpulae@DN11201_c0_g1_i1.p1